MKAYRGVIAILCTAFACADVCFFLYHWTWGLGALALSLVVLLVIILWLSAIRRRDQEHMDAVFGENQTASSQVIDSIAIPSVLTDADGRIVWRNAAFQALFAGKQLKELLPQYSERTPLAVLQQEISGSSFQVMSMNVRRKNAARQLFFRYFIDRTEAAHYQRLYTEQMPYVMLIYVDNYDELAGDLQFHRNAVLAEVERLISESCKRLGGLYTRYESGKFLCVLEAEALRSLEKEGFQLLEAAHRIDTGTANAVSLSVAVGAAPRIAQSEESARLAMELALGRGGDQVVVRDGAAYRFYGGKRQAETRQSRVKARLFSKALRQLMENNGDVFVMGHKNADMDCFGSMLGIVSCAKCVGRRGYMVLEHSNPTISDAYARMKQDGSADQLIITPDQAVGMLRPNSVLVIVDTQRASTVEAPILLENAQRLVLIDHHRRSADYIDNATLHYLESRASSACEMVTEIIQYFDEAVRPSAFVCSTLLAGITVDTKQFAFNVGSRTFDAAGYLRRNGADLSAVKLMFQNDYATYVNCAKTVERAELRKSGIAISYVETNTDNSKLIAARSADELLGIRGVMAAFVLGEDGDSIAISGRSYGRINVQLVLEKLGGGGHLTIAGAQLKGVSMDEARKLLEDCVAGFESANAAE